MKLPLKSLRENRQITQAEFSQIMNVAPSTIGLWEQGLNTVEQMQPAV